MSATWRQWTIDQVLPQRGEMMLLDELLEYEPERIVCGITVRSSSLFHDATGTVPAYVGLEYLAQTTAAHIGVRHMLAGHPPRPGLLLGTRTLNIDTARFEVGQQLAVEALAVYEHQGLAVYDCKLTDRRTDQPLMQCRLNVYEPPDLQAYLRDSQQR